MHIFKALLLMSIPGIALAQTPSLALWITDPIGGANGAQCVLPAPVAPATAPTLTENDVTQWQEDRGLWSLDPARFDGIDKLVERCFILAIDGKVIETGVALASDTGKMTGHTTLNVIATASAPDLQLISSNHGPHARLVHIATLDAVLGNHANLARQMARIEPASDVVRQPPYHQLTKEWKRAVQRLVGQKKIRVGMPVEEVIARLGPPTSVAADGPRKTYIWYFNTPMHVNPMFSVGEESGEVIGYGMDSR